MQQWFMFDNFFSLIEFFSDVWSNFSSTLMLTCGCLVFFNICMGYRQRIEGNGSWKRLLAVSVCLSLIQMLPLFAGVIGSEQIQPHSQQGQLWIMTSVAVLIVALWTGLYLLPPIRLRGSKEALAKFTDEEFLIRITDMSRQLKIPTPVVRLLNSSGGGMAIQAFAGGLPAPSLVISDGVRHRLSNDEADAIIAHELGHIANHSLWCYPLSVGISWSLAVVCSIWYGFWIGLLFGFAVQTGLGRVVSRYFEFASDLNAASVAGFRSTIQALDKIHMTSAVDNKGWRSFLAYTIATHPSHEERLQSLYEKAPVDDRPQVRWSARAARRRRFGAKIALALWLLLLIGSLWLPQTELSEFLQAILYITISLFPQFLIRKAIRKDIKTDLKRRNYQGKTKASLPVFIITVIAMLILFFALEQAENQSLYDASGEIIWIIFGIPIVLGIFLIAWGLWKGSRSPQAKIRLAIHQRRWKDAVDLGVEFQEKIKNDATLRHDLLLALWMCNENQNAIQKMGQLRTEFPDFKHPWLIEALMHLETGDANKALSLINEVRTDLQGDVSVHGIAARCYRYLGNTEKLDEEASKIEEIIPEAAAVSAFRCAVALDRCELEKAQKHWNKADTLAPGDAYITLLKAEVSHLEGNHVEAKNAFTTAKELIEATPFAFLRRELKGVEHLLTQKVSESAEIESQLSDPEVPFTSS